MKPVWSGDWPIPERIALPGCRVRVKLVPRSTINDQDASWVYQHGYEGEKAYALVRIDEALPVQVQRYCLIHELQHALVEVLDVMLEKYLEHVHPKIVATAGKIAEEELCSSTPDSSPASGS